MSKQTGLIKLEGTIGGIAFYRSGGVDLARIANGPSKERIATDVNFVRTRENNAEFGGSASAGKAFRLAFATSMQTMADSYLASRLTALFRSICGRDIKGIRGQRSILLSENHEAIAGMNFNNSLSFSSVFNAPFTVKSADDRNEATADVPSFMPATFIKAPGGATHFVLVHALGTVSDFLFNSETRSYEPANAALNSLGAVTRSDSTALDGTDAVTFSLATALPDAPKMTDDVSVIEALGIEFYQRIGTVDYLLSQGNSMKVVSVF